MKIKESKAFSFTAILVIYALAILVGYLSYILLPINLVWLKLLVADIIATILTFIFSLIFKNSSVYDPYWSVQPIVILALFAIKYGLTTSSILILIAVSIWGIRLTLNWAYTFGDLTHQDWRYTMLKEKTGVFYPIINFIGIHLVPTLVVYACILPAVFVVINKPSINLGAVIFITLSLGAVLLQGTADLQMHKFRKNRNSTFIRTGLWKYSRHPNYLAEISMWWAIGLASVCMMKVKWYLLLGAVLNTLLFIFVSIPLADNKQAKKEGFEEYKKSTFALLPIPKKG